MPYFVPDGFQRMTTLPPPVLLVLWRPSWAQCRVGYPWDVLGQEEVLWWFPAGVSRAEEE